MPNLLFFNNLQRITFDARKLREVDDIFQDEAMLRKIRNVICESHICRTTQFLVCIWLYSFLSARACAIYAVASVLGRMVKCAPMYRLWLYYHVVQCDCGVEVEQIFPFLTFSTSLPIHFNTFSGIRQ